MTITAEFVARKCKLRGTLTTVTQSDEVDGMNRPIDVETVTPVKFWWHPEETSEITDGRLVNTNRRTVYLPACTVVNDTSKLTYAGVTFEFDGAPQEWVHPKTCQVVGLVGHVVRTS